MTSLTRRAERFAQIARPSGAFAMMAVDARKPMREMFEDAGLDPSAASIASFKESVARSLGSEVSAVLCDLDSGADAARLVRDQLSGTGLILAVDTFPDVPEGDPFTEVDEALLPVAAAFGRVSALKLYVYWSPNGGEEHRRREVTRFIQFCRDQGLLSLVEGVSTVPGDDPAFNASLVSAAREFGAMKPDVYKTQVPFMGQASPEAIRDVAAEITGSLACPWVVLSKGVPGESFSTAVRASCEGGASGFLAGRAFWKEALTASDQTAWLGDRHSYARELCQIADDHARPWREAVSKG